MAGPRLQAQGWDAPLYWRESDDGWQQVGPGGLSPLALDAPVRHVSWYEADAFARWSGARLPTEFEMEAAAGLDRVREWDGYAWQWTGSAYLPYPGFRPAPGAIGEYNGKFMINQMVLRGGSLATPPGHLRPTYRNFFPARQTMAVQRVAPGRGRLMLDYVGALAPVLDEDVAAAALGGLQAARKTLPPKLFYDDEGCRLFSEITRLPEYYPTRTEMALLRRVAPEIGAAAPPGAALVEYGGSDEAKAAILLDASDNFAAYVPIDVAAGALESMADRLARSRPELDVHPIAGDFLQPVRLPAAVAGRTLMGFFPGSTVGNLDRAQARAFLDSARQTLGPAGSFLVGGGPAQSARRAGPGL